MSTLRSSMALVACSSLLLIVYIIAASCVHSHPALDHRRHHARHGWFLVGQKKSLRTRRRRSHVTPSDVTTGRGSSQQRRRRYHDDDDAAARETDTVAADAINRLFGAPRPMSPVAPLHLPAAAHGRGSPARHGSHTRHRGRHRQKTAGRVGSSKTFTLELPLGCEAEPCQHDGQCYTDPSSSLGYACRCQPGYSGDFCEIESYCSSEPCLNGGICTSKGSSASTSKYSCKCVDGYTGNNCEIPPLSSNKSEESIGSFVSNIANTHNPVIWPMLTAAILALLLTTFIACCICVELRRNSLIKRYKLYKTVGLEKEFPMTSSVSLALRMTKRWLRCRCLKSSEEQLQQPYTVINAPLNSLSAHNNAELPTLKAQASEDSFWSETPAYEQAQRLRELEQLRSLQQLQLMQQRAYDAQQPANQMIPQQQPAQVQG